MPCLAPTTPKERRRHIARLNAPTPSPADARRDSSAAADAPYPPIPASVALVHAAMAWSIHGAMRQLEARDRGAWGASPKLPPDFNAAHRSSLVDYIIGLANFRRVSTSTMHLAVCVFDKYLATQEEAICTAQAELVAATCLKVADVFSEKSREYYKQENTSDYVEATRNSISVEQMLGCEKSLVPKLGFNLDLPCVQWFLQCYLVYGRFVSGGSLAKIACFIGDVALLDFDLLVYPSSLRAQALLVLAALLAQQSQAEKTRGQGGVEDTTHLGLLQHWSQRVRPFVCKGNKALDAQLCMRALVRTIVDKRRAWKSEGLAHVEEKHQAVARKIVYPAVFPVSALVRYILPTSAS